MWDTLDVLWYLVAAAEVALLGRVFLVYATTRNPFAGDARRKRAPYVTDQKKRAEVIKQIFHVEKVRRMEASLTTAFTLTLRRCRPRWTSSSSAPAPEASPRPSSWPRPARGSSSWSSTIRQA